LSSHTFAAHALVVTGAKLAYNRFRWIGQDGLLGADIRPRHSRKHIGLVAR